MSSLALSASPLTSIKSMEDGLKLKSSSDDLKFLPVLKLLLDACKKKNEVIEEPRQENTNPYPVVPLYEKPKVSNDTKILKQQKAKEKEETKNKWDLAMLSCLNEDNKPQFKVDHGDKLAQPNDTGSLKKSQTDALANDKNVTASEPSVQNDDVYKDNIINAIPDDPNKPETVALSEQQTVSTAENIQKGATENNETELDEEDIKELLAKLNKKDVKELLEFLTTQIIANMDPNSVNNKDEETNSLLQIVDLIKQSLASEVNSDQTEKADNNTDTQKEISEQIMNLVNQAQVPGQTEENIKKINAELVNKVMELVKLAVKDNSKPADMSTTTKTEGEAQSIQDKLLAKVMELINTSASGNNEQIAENTANSSQMALNDTQTTEQQLLARIMELVKKLVNENESVAKQVQESFTNNIESQSQGSQDNVLTKLMELVKELPNQNKNSQTTDNTETARVNDKTASDNQSKPQTLKEKLMSKIMEMTKASPVQNNKQAIAAETEAKANASADLHLQELIQSNQTKSYNKYEGSSLVEIASKVHIFSSAELGQPNMDPNGIMKNLMNLGANNQLTNFGDSGNEQSMGQFGQNLMNYDQNTASTSTATASQGTENSFQIMSFKSDMTQLAQQDSKIAPFVDKQSLHEMIERIKTYDMKGKQEIQLTLKPPLVGKLLVQLTTEKGLVKVTVFADNHHTGKMLENTISQLKQSLTDQGVKLDSVKVQIDHDKVWGNTQNNTFLNQDESHPENFYPKKKGSYHSSNEGFENNLEENENNFSPRDKYSVIDCRI